MMRSCFQWRLPVEAAAHALHHSAVLLCLQPLLFMCRRRLARPRALSQLCRISFASGPLVMNNVFMRM